MRYFRSRATVCCWTPLFLLSGLIAVCPGEEPDAPLSSPLSSPVSAAESLQHFKLADDLRIELVAHEPQVVDPVAIRFDERGNLWVVEMRDYPSGPAEGEKPASRIRRLRDNDGDGFYEEAVTFADKLLFVTGIQPWKGGLIVTLAGKVMYMRDVDGDGRSDQQQVWYTGFAEQNSQLRANHPRFALDNRVYVANGLRGGTVVDPRRAEAPKLSISGMDFRFDPRSFDYQAVSGVGQFGLTFDDYGNRFVCSNRNPLKHIVLENEHLQSNPSVPISAVAHDVAVPGEASRIYPISRAWTTSTLHAGQFTAACGVLVYRGNGLGHGFRGNGFTCDPTGNLVHREVLRPLGATFTSRAARRGVEFLASPDEWFRPVNLVLGPEGALYVVDMYRAVIEHPKWMPTELRQRTDMRHGDDRGRIYRIRAEGGELAAPAAETTVSSRQLLAWLKGDNAWLQETAARLIYERQEKALSAPLTRLAVDGATAIVRLRALWCLRGLGEDDVALLRRALRDPHPRVREQAVALSEKHVRDATLRAAVARLAGDTDARVRFRTALFMAGLTANQRRRLQVKDVLAQITVTARDDDPWLRRAVKLAAGRQAAEVAEATIKLVLRGNPHHREHVTATIEELAQLAGSLASLTSQRELLRRLLEFRDDQYDRQVAGFRGLLGGLARRRMSLSRLTAGDAALEDSVRRLWARIVKQSATGNAQAARRLAAIRLLAYRPAAAAVLAEIALEDGEQAPRLAAIRSLARQASNEVWPKLLERFRSESPAVRRAILDGVLTNSARTSGLLDAIEKGLVKTAEIDRLHTNRLMRHRDVTIKKRAARLFADSVPADRQKVLEEYRQVLTMEAEAERGRVVFRKNCATCHRVAGIGVNVAPDIADSRTRTPQQLLTDILQPNRAIDSNYVSYSVLVEDGRVLNGILAAETSSSLTLRQPENKTLTLLRSEIAQLRSDGVSLMPEGLEKNINHQQMADLIAFIKNWRYLDGRTPLGPAK